jgi:hypothetical protein
MEELKQGAGSAPHRDFVLEASHARLEKLVGELLTANQELRFKLAQLEHQAAALERGLAQSCAAAAVLWP